MRRMIMRGMIVSVVDASLYLQFQSGIFYYYFIFRLGCAGAVWKLSPVLE